MYNFATITETGLPTAVLNFLLIHLALKYKVGDGEYKLPTVPYNVLWGHEHPLFQGLALLQSVRHFISGV